MHFYSALILLGLLACLTGCSATVYPPTHPKDPVTIYIADYGHHSTVTLPLGENAFVEYSFGDWNYMAKNHTSPCDGIGALCFSSAACFGRRETVRAADSAGPALFGDPKVSALNVSAEEVAKVEDDLDSRWQREISTRMHNPDDDTDFVIDSCRYGWNSNCNDFTASLLRELGGTVEGPTSFSSFQIGKK